MGIDITAYRARVGAFCLVLPSLLAQRMKPLSRRGCCCSSFAGRCMLGLLAVTFQAQTIAALLMIGGVEPNPGPDLRPDLSRPSTSHQDDGEALAHSLPEQATRRKTAPDPHELLERALGNWRDTIQIMYPDMDTHMYCVPPVYFNRVPYDRVKVAGQDALKLKQPSPKQDQGGAAGNSKQKQRAPKRSKDAAAAVEEGEDESGLRQAPQEHRASKATAKASGASSPDEPYSMWPRDNQPHVQPENVQDSDLPDDLAQAHVLHCLKALGEEQKEVMFVVSHSKFENYLDKIEDILRQMLEKSEKVIKHLVSDFAPNLLIRKTMVMPSITSHQLLEALDSDQNLTKDICQCLDASDLQSAVEMCLCADHLSDPRTPWEVEQAMPALKSWWQKRMAYRTDPEMSEEVYLELITRFAGPATTVEIHCVVPPRLEVRTEGEAVSEVGERIARLVLTQHQLEIFHQKDPLVCMTGAPGTGKTLMLTLKGLQWLYAGHDVYVVFVDYQSLPAAHLIFHQLQMTLQTDAETSATGKPYLRFLPMDSDEDLEYAIRFLTSAAKDEQLHVILDEAQFTGVEDRSGAHACQLITTLTNRIQNFRIWTSALYHSNVPDCLLELKPLSVAFRCPPVVQRVVAAGVSVAAKQNLMPNYDSLPAPSHGSEFIRLSHGGGGHTGGWPAECFKCGQNLAETLRRLHVGAPAVPAYRDTNSGKIAAPPPLRYRDVLVVTSSAKFHGGCGFVQGLQHERIPLNVIDVDLWDTGGETLQKRLADFAVPKSDCVAVTVSGAVRSMERKVVAHLEGRMKGTDSYEQKYNEMADVFDSFMDFSRCTSQLIIVRKDDNGTDDLSFPASGLWKVLCISGAVALVGIAFYMLKR
ncbi:hypothetical protein BaRGS_00019455 [Batillaria attramentaria]|uniref:AAA+ ATPase domain-containing protein n=1 Tax=Batillaria attramentaria TaxID=370345 RepID=A0ABD0KQ48_9CAEN